MADNKLLYERKGDIAVLTLNDPAVRNAVGLAMAEELAEGIARAAGEARAILLTGAGATFCAGANMSGGNLADDGAGPPDVGASLETHINPLMKAIRDLPIPIVTAVRGAAAGVGCSFALAGDIILASETALFLQAFVNIGLVPDGGSTWLLSRAVGRVRALEMMLMGERLPAARAHEWGLVTRLVADDQLDAAAFEVAQRLAAGPTQAIAMIRRNAWRAADGSLDDVLDAERESQRAAGLTADHNEGVAAFLAKRPAQFKGR